MTTTCVSCWSQPAGSKGFCGACYAKLMLKRTQQSGVDYREDAMVYAQFDPAKHVQAREDKSTVEQLVRLLEDIEEELGTYPGDTVLERVRRLVQQNTNLVDEVWKLHAHELPPGMPCQCEYCVQYRAGHSEDIPF